MKEPKQQKSEEVAAARARTIRQAWLDRAKACGDVRATLTQLEGSLVEHSKALEMRKMRIARLSPDIQRVVQNAQHRCLLTDASLLAAELIAGKPLSAIILEEQKQPQLDRFYRSLNFGGGGDIVVDPDSLVFFKEWDAERAAVQILTAAIKLQKKTGSETTRASMERFSKTVAQVRAETAKQVLALLAELRRVAEPDQALAKGLDEDEIAELQPKPFPLQLLSSEAWTWLVEAVSAGMIDAAELSDLQPETVSPETEYEAAVEPWLQGQI